MASQRQRCVRNQRTRNAASGEQHVNDQMPQQMSDKEEYQPCMGTSNTARASTRSASSHPLPLNPLSWTHPWLPNLAASFLSSPPARAVSSSVAQGMPPSRKACLHVLALYAMWSRAFALWPNFFMHAGQDSSTVCTSERVVVPVASMLVADQRARRVATSPLVSGTQRAHKLQRICPQLLVARAPRTFGFLRLGASDVELPHCFHPFSLVPEKFHPWLRMMIRIGHGPQGRGGLAHPSQVFKEHVSGSFRCSAQRVPLCAASSAQFCEWVQALSQQEQVRGEPLKLVQDSGIRRVASTRVPSLSSHTSADAHPHVVDVCSGKGSRS